MIFNFALQISGNRGAANPNLATQMTLYDATGQEIHRVVTLNDGTRTTNNVLLLPGTYYVRMNAVSQSGATFSPLSYRLLGSVVSDPVGPSWTRSNSNSTNKQYAFNKRHLHAPDGCTSVADLESNV